MKEITSLFSASKCPLLRSPLTATSKLIFTVIVLSVFACLLCRISVQFTSVAQSCLTLCDPMGCSTPGFPVHHQLQELSQTYVHRVSDPTLCPPLLLLPFSSCLQSFPVSFPGSFPMTQLFTSGGQIMGVSASASVLPMNIQD